MFEAQALIYQIYRAATFRALLQTLLQHQKQANNSELSKHFHESHTLNDIKTISILQNNIKTAAAGRYRSVN